VKLTNLTINGMKEDVHNFHEPILPINTVSQKLKLNTHSKTVEKYFKYVRNNMQPLYIINWRLVHGLDWVKKVEIWAGMKPDWGNNWPNVICKTAGFSEYIIRFLNFINSRQWRILTFITLVTLNIKVQWVTLLLVIQIMD
jgi:hypothetical protein